MQLYFVKNRFALHNSGDLLRHSHIRELSTSTPAEYAYLVQNIFMEKRLLGFILTLVGIAGLIYTGISFMNGGTGQRNIKAMIFAGILGAIFFFAGIGLIKNTKDKAT